MKISLIVNFEKNDAKKIAKEVVELLHNAKVEILCDKATSENIDEQVNVNENHIEEADLCIVIGGDGTLRRDLGRIVIPIDGVALYLAVGEVYLLILRGESCEPCLVFAPDSEFHFVAAVYLGSLRLHAALPICLVGIADSGVMEAVPHGEALLAVI